MIETIKLKDKDLKLSSAAAFLLVYKQQFKKEPLQDIMTIVEKTQGSEDKEDYANLLSAMDLDVIYNLAWALAKTANYANIDDPVSFYIEYSDFKPIQHIEKIINMALVSISPDFEIEEEVEEKN